LELYQSYSCRRAFAWLEGVRFERSHETPINAPAGAFASAGLR